MEGNYRHRTRERTLAGSNEATGKCPHCGAAVDPGYEICPFCGWKQVDYCTFCGFPIQPGDADCPECGMPSDGLICPDCNTRSFRPFCGQCGRPLSRAARKVVDKARQDVKVQEAARLLKRVAELRSEITGGIPGAEETAQEIPQEPTEGEIRLREMMSKAGLAAALRPSVSKRRVGRSREEILSEYNKAVEEANKALEEMLPPAGSTPQEQRNYYTARKVAVTELVEEKWYSVTIDKTMGWECNRCHVLHQNPSQCAVREFGGRWIVSGESKVVAEGTPGAVEHKNVTERIVYKRQ